MWAKSRACCQPPPSRVHSGDRRLTGREQFLGPGHQSPQVRHTVRQALRVRQVGGSGAQADDLGFFLRHSLRGVGKGRIQELAARLGHQDQSRGDRDVGQNVGRVLEPKAVLDQTLLPRLRDQPWKTR